MCALGESSSGIDFSDCHSYIGVSAGSFIATGLANGMSPRELCASFIENVGVADDIFQPSMLMRPARAEFAKRLALLPGLVTSATLGSTMPSRGVRWRAPSKAWGARCPRACS